MTGENEMELKTIDIPYNGHIPHTRCKSLLNIFLITTK